MAADDRLDVGAPAGVAVASAATPYQRALADPAFRGRIQRRYAGKHDLLDALWWLDHPREPGPSGATPPAVLLDAARRPLYSRSPGSGSVGRYTAAAAAERTDRDAVLAALDDAQEPVESPPVAPTALAPPAHPPEPTEAVHRGRRLLGAAVTASLTAFALLSWGRGATTAQTTEDGVVLVETRTVGLDALTALPRLGDPESRVVTRGLAVIGDTTVVAELARGLVCIELRAGDGASGSCRSVPAVRKDGIHVPFPTGSREVYDLRWSSDGRLRLSLPR